jgi:hypothetical protein
LGPDFSIRPAALGPRLLFKNRRQQAKAAGQAKMAAETSESGGQAKTAAETSESGGASKDGSRNK